jgi:hypothetical protein
MKRAEDMRETIADVVASGLASHAASRLNSIGEKSKHRAAGAGIRWGLPGYAGVFRP